MSMWTHMPNRLLRKLANLPRNIRRLGLVDMLGLYRYRIHEAYRDWRLGVRTGGLLDFRKVPQETDCSNHDAISYRCLDVALQYLNPQSGKDVVLDYGCGKGRVVVTAATYPFRRVIGIELSPQLSDVARENVRLAANRLKCPQVEIITADAADWEVPSDVTVAFLFNPFAGRVLAEVQRRLRESLEAAPRALRVVYMHPVGQPDSFADCDWLVKRSELSTADWNEVNFVVYESRWQSSDRDAVGNAAQMCSE